MIQPSQAKALTLLLSEWSILDFELAYDGLVDMAQAGNGIICQPRADDKASGNFHPGAAFVESIIVDYLDWRTTEIFEHLETVRFDDPEDDDRRVRLLLKFHLNHVGMGIPALIALALEQSVRAPA